MRRILLTLMIIFVCWFAAKAAHAGELKLPDKVIAGTEVSIPASGSGETTLIVVGPGEVIKKKVQSGQALTLSGNELRTAGRYTVIAGDNSGSFYVVPAKPENVAFLARPSRVPTATHDVISGTAYVFDKYDNLSVAPAKVKFDLSVGDAPAVSRTLDARDGIAWTHMDSGRKAGAAQFVASLDDTSVRRVVQQVAAEPCNLRMKASPSKDGILVATDPIHDCSGNPVPDGTIVTFTEVDSRGKSTVDARIKRGIATAELPASENATITVASGVVVGNELHWGGRR